MNKIILLACCFLLQACLNEGFVSEDSKSSTVGGEDRQGPEPPMPPKAPPSGECDGSDCNYCVTDVQKQFAKAATQMSWTDQLWGFVWPQAYGPSGVEPRDIFDGIEADAHEFDIPDKHIQGFTATNSVRYPYAGSHSHTRGTSGGIFVVEKKKDKLELATLHKTETNHPSGVHVIGHELAYADKVGQKLVLVDLNSLNHAKKRTFPIEDPLFGGGLGLAKISDGKYLLITAGPGGQKAAPRFNHFYELSAAGLSFLGKSEVTIPAAWERKYIFSENLSVLTECGTGDIYTVHTTGDQDPVGAVSGSGYWRLSKLTRADGKLSLKAIQKLKTEQNMTNCSSRATAMVSGSKDNKMEFYCHGYAKEPDGAKVPIYGYVLGPPKDKTTDADSFSFKKATSP